MHRQGSKNRLLPSKQSYYKRTRKIYLTSSLERNPSSARLKLNSYLKQNGPINLKQSSPRGRGSTLLSDRKNYYATTKKLSKEKSTMLSTLLSTRHNKFQAEKKLHQSGRNCRIVLIAAQEEHQVYVEVQTMGDISAALKTEFPTFSYFRSVPTQLTMDYFLTQPLVEASFLNGQTLYLKPASRINSMCEKENVCLNSFDIIKMIGSGGFSKVFLCRFKETGEFYAMKVIDKQMIVKNKKKKIIANERNIMRQSTHPFLIEMKYCFQTDAHLIFILEYCPGGELFGLIRKYKRLNEDTARFYIIEIFLGLSYLHQSHVVYRDIKPQNILLSQDGHVKIADLGLAKPNMDANELAYSFCGSPQYMSPEMIMQVGHSYPVDYYCMGALLYELLVGLPPYYSRDTNEIYEAVLGEELTFPEEVEMSAECKSLLRGLLCKDAKCRLGSLHGVKEILAHPWFGKNSYKAFLNKEIQPPVHFGNVSRIDLDKPLDEKGRKELEDMLKTQKNQHKRFKAVMKNFYYDYKQKEGEKENHKATNKSFNKTHRKIIRSTSRKSKEPFGQIRNTSSRKQSEVQ